MAPMAVSILRASTNLFEAQRDFDTEWARYKREKTHIFMPLNSGDNFREFDLLEMREPTLAEAMEHENSAEHEESRERQEEK